MKKYTHAWIAFKAIERLEGIPQADPNWKPAQSIVKWFKAHRDGVINGAWYPDSIIKDNSTSHILKLTPDLANSGIFPALNTAMQFFKLCQNSPCWKKGYQVNTGTNLPERCEAFSHSVIDNLKVQQVEARGSPVAPTGNHLAQVLFMLSHYVADAHVPLHCDSRKFSDGQDIHSEMEDVWEVAVSSCIAIDAPNECFRYDANGYPLIPNQAAFDGSVLKPAQDELAQRSFSDGYGTGNSNVLRYMNAVCRYSYLLSYSFIPPGFDETNVFKATWKNLAGQTVTVDQLNVAVLSDAIDSVARVWLRVWRRFVDWWSSQGNPALPPGF